MVKSVFKRFLLAIYEIGKREYEGKQALLRVQQLKQSAIIHPEAIIGSEARFFNNQSNKEKIRIGAKSQIRGELLLYKHGGEIEIGEFTFVGPESKIWSAKKISIGNRVLISHNVNIHDNISHPLNSKLRHEDFVHILEKGLQSQIDLREKEIVIEDDAWIGFNSIILKGVRIGRGAIVGAGTVVTQDVPPFAVVVGNPPKTVKYSD